MCLLHLAVTSGASGHLERPLSCAYTRAVTHIQLRPPPPLAALLKMLDLRMCSAPPVMDRSSHLILHAPVAFSSPDVSQILGGCCLSPRRGPPWLPHAAVPLLPRDALVSRSPPHIEYGPFTYRCVPHSLMANSLKCHQYSSAVPICPDAPRGPAVAPSSHVQLSSSPRSASSP